MHLSYHVKLKKTIAAHFDNTVYWYRRALDFYIDFCLEKWDLISGIRGIKYQIKFIEEQTIAVNARVLTVPDESNFKQQFPDFPSYLRRVAMNQASGLVSAYFKRLNKWNTMSDNNRSKRPGRPSAGKAARCERSLGALHLRRRPSLAGRPRAQRRRIFLRTDRPRARG